MRPLLHAASLYCLALAVTAAGAFGGQLILSDLPVPAGASTAMDVIFRPQQDPVSALQFDLEFDSTAMDVSLVIGAAASSSGKALFVTAPDANHKRFLFVNTDNDPIPDGTLATLTVTVKAGVPNGIYPLGIPILAAAGPDGRAALLSAVEGAIMVLSPISVPPSSVLNGASFLSGPVAPGEIVSVFAPGIGLPADTNPADFRILFDGTPAPVVYAGPSQANLVVPYAVAGKSAAQLEIRAQGITLASLSVPVVPAAPAIFTLDASGTGPAAALNQDTSINSADNPAEKGSIVVLFATGAGQTNPPSADGQPAAEPLPKPVLPVSVQIDGISAEVLYAGAAPGLIAGMTQINCRIPVDVTSGPAVSVILRVGTAESPAVTIAVK